MSSTMNDAQRRQGGALLTAGGGGLVTIGSFLPWVTARSGFGSVSRNGIEGGGDGLVMLALGVALLLLGIAMLSGMDLPDAAEKSPFVLGAIGIFVTFLNYQEASDRVADIDSGFVAGSVGTGIWVMGLGALLAIGGGALLSGGAVAAVTTYDKATRPCPHCERPMQRDASTCPHCIEVSEPWTFHENRWWQKQGEEWFVYDEPAKRWQKHEPS